MKPLPQKYLPILETSVSFQQLNRLEFYSAAEICAALKLSNVSQTMKIVTRDNKTIANHPCPRGISWYITFTGMLQIIFFINTPECKFIRQKLISEVLNVNA